MFKRLFFALYFVLAVLPLLSYEANPSLPVEIWQKAEPYFLPEDHPAKQALDTIFRKKRATLSLKAMKKAGFRFETPRGPLNLVAAKHKKLKGYLVKVYLDSQKVHEWTQWIKRIKGASQIQQSIDVNQCRHLMKVPQKWIYPLPQDPSPAGLPVIHRKHFILVVEDMQILSPGKNKMCWMHKPDPELLDALYVVLTKNLLIDSIYIDNIPFCKDGKLAFIDTEHYNSKSKPLRLHRLANKLPGGMQEYWLKKVRKWKKQNPL